MHASRIPRAIPASLAAAAISITLIFVTPVAADSILTATLTGAEEVPGPGDAAGSGMAMLDITTAAGEICVTLEWSISDGVASAAHIHQAPAGTAGDVVLPIFTSPNDTGFFQDCFIDTALAPLLEATPANYYVNIHSETYPDGAIRGQLAVGTAPPTDGAAPSMPNVAMPAPDTMAAPTAPIAPFLAIAALGVLGLIWSLALRSRRVR